MGPDEFQMMVNHNCYTNFMGKFTLQYTIDILEEFSRKNVQIYKNIANKLSIDEYFEVEKEELAERKNNYYKELLQELIDSAVLPGVKETMKLLKAKGLNVVDKWENLLL